MLTVLTASAQNYYVTNNLAASNHTVISVSSPVKTTSITLFSTNTAATLVYLFDGYLIRTNAAYTNYTAALSDVVSTVITSSGSTNLFTNSVWTTSANAVAAANVAATPLASIVVPPNSDPVTYQIPYTFTKFLNVSNNLAGLSFVLSYRTP